LGSWIKLGQIKREIPSFKKMAKA